MSVALLLAAAASTAEATICADRPSKANSVCTVPPTHWQLEVSAVDWMRTRDGGARVTSFGSTFAKLGLSDGSDIEVGFSPYVEIDQRGLGTSGVGDTIVRIKQRLTRSGARVQGAIIPFVKLPTARHDIGNGKVEAGIAAPLSTALTKTLTVTAGPELDLLADADGHGRHMAVTNLVNLGWNLASRLSLSAELWNNINFDPTGTVRAWSADGSAAYLLNGRTQLDGGVNLGLTATSPSLELYGGVSVLF